jgi:Pentapeptide repeats (8 copies)
MTEDHMQEDRRAHWAKVPRALLEGFAVVGALLIIVVCLWAFDRPTNPTHKHEFLQSLVVLLAALVGLSGLYFWQVLAAYVRQRTGLETEDLRGADLSMSDLSWTNLRGANLRGANLRAAILLRTDLRRTDLRRADLRRAILSNAVLMGSELSEANLSEANLRGVDLRQADLSRANLSGAFGWTDAQFRAVISLESATMPNGQKYEEWLKDKRDRGEDGGGRDRP